MNTNNKPSTATHSATTNTTVQPYNLNTKEGLFLHAQTKLLDIVDEFMQIGHASKPIETINELLYTWLASENADFSLVASHNHLNRALDTVNFLASIYEEHNRMRKFAETDEDKKRKQPVATPGASIFAGILSSQQKDIDNVKADLVEAVSDYMGNATSIQSINTVVDCWAKSSTTDLNDPENKRILNHMLKLTSFLTTIASKYEVVRIATEASVGNSI